MYASVNFKTKKAFKEAVEAGRQISVFAPGLGTPKRGAGVCGGALVSRAPQVVRKCYGRERHRDESEVS